MEVQAHSSSVERLRLTFNNNTLISVGSDGSLCVFDIKDKEPKLRKDGKELPTIAYSDDILIPKNERDKFREDLDQLKREIQIKKDA
jgi:cilia- and flagella-associated protein 57